MKQNESLLDIVALLYRWRKWLIALPLLSGIIAAFVSLALPNYYEASTLFYPASPDLAKPAPVGNQSIKSFIYGSSHDLDRLISISKSKEVRNYLRDEFKLYEHYEIDPNDKKARRKLYLKLNKLFNIEKTKYDAIRLSVEDTDALFATKMANAARIKIDALAQSVLKESQNKQMVSYGLNIEEKEKFYQSLMDSLNASRKKYNIFHTGSQGEAFSTSMVELEGKHQNISAQLDFLKGTNAPRDSILILNSKKKGIKVQLDKLYQDIQSYNKGYEQIITLERQLKDFGEQLNLDKQRATQIESAFKGKVSAIHLIEEAEEPEMKSRPKRSIIVIGIVLLTFLLLSLWIIIKEQFEQNNWRQHFEDV